ncbi:MAG: EAL domain-containing protein, partial [Hyphomicrobium sp.]
VTDSRRDIADRLTVEMTETAMIHDFDAAKAFFDLLREIGCKIAIDDFGAGYTSFRHLKSLNVDMLKIDGALVENLKDDSRGRALVKSMIEMAGALGLETVAEWVGDEEAAAFLEAAGVTYLQGYLFGEPVPAEELARAGVL